MRRTLLSVVGWATIVAFTVASALLQMLLLALIWPVDRRRLISGRLFHLGSALGARLNPMWRFEVVGALPAHGPGRAVVVSRHCSNMDPFFIALLPWEMKWLAKRSLFRVPIAGWAMRLSGDVPLERGNRDSARLAMQRCARWLRCDVPVMMFPEGTRSRDGRLGTFKDGAFRLAIETGADVVPVGIAGTRDALRKHDWRCGFAHARVRVGEPISTRGMTLADVDALKQRARAAVEDLSRSIAAGNELTPDSPAAAERDAPDSVPARRPRPAPAA